MENQPQIESVERHYPYDALLVLGAVMDWNEHMNKWDFPPIVDRYAGKLVMGKVRAFAASLVSELAPVLLVTGGSDTHPITGEKASRSVELSKLLINTYGVVEEKVIPMGTAEASHTLGNAENVISYITNNPSVLKERKIAVLSPRFQAERAKMMFDQNPYFRENHIEVDWLIAEDEIVKRHPEMSEYFEWIYNTPEAEINKKMEEKGIKDLNDGGYKPVS